MMICSISAVLYLLLCTNHCNVMSIVIVVTSSVLMCSVEKCMLFYITHYDSCVAVEASHVECSCLQVLLLSRCDALCPGRLWDEKRCTALLPTRYVTFPCDISLGLNLMSVYA